MAFAALLSFAPAIILLQFCFNPLYKIYSLECISEPACFSLKYIKYCISCITVYTYTIKTAERFSVPPQNVKKVAECHFFEFYGFCLSHSLPGGKIRKVRKPLGFHPF